MHAHSCSNEYELSGEDVFSQDSTIIVLSQNNNKMTSPDHDRQHADSNEVTNQTSILFVYGLSAHGSEYISKNGSMLMIAITSFVVLVIEKTAVELQNEQRGWVHKPHMLDWMEDWQWEIIPCH